MTNVLCNENGKTIIYDIIQKTQCFIMFSTVLFKHITMKNKEEDRETKNR